MNQCMGIWEDAQRDRQQLDNDAQGVKATNHARMLKQQQDLKDFVEAMTTRLFIKSEVYQIYTSVAHSDGEWAKRTVDDAVIEGWSLATTLPAYIAGRPTGKSGVYGANLIVGRDAKVYHRVGQTVPEKKRFNQKPFVPVAVNLPYQEKVVYTDPVDLSDIIKSVLTEKMG